MNPLVSVEWLEHHLEDPDIVILDASINTSIHHKKEEETEFIKHSIFFDLLNIFSEPNSPYPFTSPNPAIFEEACRSLGINNYSKIIVYDNKGIHSSPRAWWLFKLMGHYNVSVLNGGLPAWKTKGLPISRKHHNNSTLGDFTANYNEALIKSFEDIILNETANKFLVVDVRPENRFNSTVPEPRPEIRSGKIFGSINIPFSKVLDGIYYKSVNELEVVLKPILEQTKPIVFSCGSGITACIVMLATFLVSTKPASLYDGSWTEYAKRK